tara:strand:- start:779 stop:1156 length:378 start_codon:yes stop_codon:yes gene_type:complete
MDEESTGALGQRAEQYAFRYLIRRGLIPVARNFRTRRGEIDLIMREARCIICVEVRYRASGSFVNARLSVDRHKQAKLGKTAAVFLARNPVFRNYCFRFDVLGINRDASGQLSVDWLQDAFRPNT